ncbi:SO_0444 family Cu/Zn efflux transporter [Shewanella intestini]|uniref:SO_0444 family Cu/Zn efflux transporter n=1 Tax=Shewanella intestini TaxID=2017544 RepID=A0ABS5I2D2_9GAMM|nr:MULTISPECIES: SO_0444 family Cu/Zn efflux transporter [Shewanella]MBR9727555.1 SO_0444 family Cu/Zn efflux transporter [Shewanella intestini]MRG35295.1 SO_0444 family Cu/Zn efflux transporter [Shewanella sp. XMDDZSB0408]
MLVTNFIHLFLESAPWLLLGLILAGLLKVFVPMAWMQKQLGGHGFKTVVKAAVLGAPLPLCSCGVIPAAVGLRRSGASKAATTSFLVSTPETGVDSVTVSYVLLGPFMAIVRPIAAVVSAVVAGLLVGRDDKDITPINESVNAPTDNAEKSGVTKSCCSKKNSEVKAEPKPELKSCCSSKADTSVKAESASCCSSKVDTPVKAESASCCSSKADTPVKAESASCCSSKADTPVKAESASCCSSTQDMATELRHESVLSRIFTGLHYAATDLVKDTTLWLLLGLFFAALVQTYVPADFLAKWGDGILAMLVMVVVSVPMYICATASTPIAAGLLLAGVSPGAVLVFMMAGPATNIATLGVVANELGKRALFGYLGGVLGVALFAGLVVNYLVATFGFQVMPQIGGEHELLPQGIVMVSGIVLAVLMVKVIWDKLPRKQKNSSCCAS